MTMVTSSVQNTSNKPHDVSIQKSSQLLDSINQNIFNFASKLILPSSYNMRTPKRWTLRVREDEREAFQEYQKNKALTENNKLQLSASAFYEPKDNTLHTQTVPSTPDIKAEVNGTDMPNLCLKTAEAFGLNASDKILIHSENRIPEKSRVYLMARPLSTGTAWKKMRSMFTGGKPAHVALIASSGPGKCVNAIFTAQYNSKNKLAVSNERSDFAVRDRIAWESATELKIKENGELFCPRTGMLIKPLSTALTTDQLKAMYEEFKEIDSFRGNQNTRLNYANGYTSILRYMGPRGVISGIILAQPIFAQSLLSKSPVDHLFGAFLGVIAGFVSTSSPKFGAGFLTGLAVIAKDITEFSLGFYVGCIAGVSLGLRAGLYKKGNNCQTVVSTALIDYQEMAQEQDLPLLTDQDFLLPEDVSNLGWVKYPTPEIANKNQSLS